MYSIEDYDFDLREDLIAQTPAAGRDRSRLLHVDRGQEKLSDCNFFDLPGLLKAGDLIIINNTKVVPARLYGMKESGGKAEILVLEHPESLHDSMRNSRWCLLKTSKKPKIGSRIFFERDITGTVEELADGGLTKILFNGRVSIDLLLEDEGWVPLPPYIKRDNNDNDMSTVDRERYQTIFSEKRGAVAAPTAGLHFTEETVAELEKADITVAGITLHVGYGTFQPVRVNDIREHVLGEEYYSISPETAETITQAKREKRRIIAVGTTTVRTLESVAASSGHIEPGSGKTGLLITPGFTFRAIDGLITNFHLPKSSLLFLVSAFGGKDLIKRAYEHAVKREYRFYSYGDAMLII